MEGANAEVEDFLKEIYLDSDSDSNDNETYYKNILYYRKPIPRPPPEPPKEEKECTIDFEKYLQENCRSRIKLLDRSTFHQTKRPIILAINHFREKCYYLSKWLDRIYQLTLTYGDRIEFVVGDFMDIDVMYPNTNPIDFYCGMVRPEDESPMIYAIDENKRIYQHFDAHKTVETLAELCENLLQDQLYPSEPIPEINETLVKICVHKSYYELVENSSKNILFIVGLGQYRINDQYEPNYEVIAQELQDSNVDVVYIDGDKNYVPFKYHANSYPTLIFVPSHDKDDFIHYTKGPRDKENIMSFIQENLGPDGESIRKMERLKCQYKPFTLPPNCTLTFDDLPEYINNNYPQSLKMLDRNSFPKSKMFSIIYFMDFKGYGLTHFLNHLKIMYQVAQSRYNFSIDYLIADLSDIDILYPKWYRRYIENMKLDKSIPHVYAVDRMQNITKIEYFKTPSSLHYYWFKLCYKGLFYSQTRPTGRKSKGIETLVAHNLLSHIQQSKTDIFLTVYWGNYIGSHKILPALDEVAVLFKNVSIKFIKIDAKLNYIPLQYTSSIYPVHFFIPAKNRDENTIRFLNPNQSKEAILKFLIE